MKIFLRSLVLIPIIAWGIFSYYMYVSTAINPTIGNIIIGTLIFYFMAPVLIGAVLALIILLLIVLYQIIRWIITGKPMDILS